MYGSEDLASLMEEPVGGHNHGRMDGHPLGTDTSFDYRMAGGFSVIQEGEGRQGWNAHRGVVAPYEHVDEETLKERVERLFGFTSEEIASVYSSKYLTPEKRQLRARIDARLLALYASGGNMQQFSRVVGLNRKTMDRAVARAREVAAA